MKSEWQAQLKETNMNLWAQVIGQNYVSHQDQSWAPFLAGLKLECESYQSHMVHGMQGIFVGRRREKEFFKTSIYR